MKKVENDAGQIEKTPNAFAAEIIDNSVVSERQKLRESG